MPKKHSKSEAKLQTLVSSYLKQAYPNTEFMCDLAAGMKLSIGIATLAKRWRSNSGFPDIIILERRGEWNALMLELKTEKASTWKKDGSLRASQKDHLENQQAMHIKLRNKGYYACFGKGFDHCRSLIDWYMGSCNAEPPKYIKKNLPKLF